MVNGVETIFGITRRVIAALLNIKSLLVYCRLGWILFARLDALVPCVLKVSVASRPTVTEPRTTTSATAEFTGFSHGATCEARRTDTRRCRGYCLHVEKNQQRRKKNRYESHHLA